MISDIRLQRFRSYTDESFEFSGGVNIIVGPNASGKTNLLEAIYMLAAGKSFRARDGDTIMFGKKWTRLDAQIEQEERILKLILNDNGSVGKSLTINGQELKRILPTRRLPVVLFEPNHLQLFRDGPDVRRDYIDDLLERLTPAYGLLRRQYRRVLAQRNSLLKHQPASLQSQLFAWNIRLSELGGQIAQQRRELVDHLNQRLPELYQLLATAKLKATIQYASRLPAEQYSSQLLHQLEAHLNQDIERGFTGFGPHRDDLIISLGQHNIQESASRGEVRTILLALKIIELELVTAAYGKQPLLLLDDVFSELDGARRQALTKAMVNHQVFITTTDADIVVQHFLGNCTVIPMVRAKGY